jgi:threonine dehydrogenase-like Zn-dependent dehydrogenase
VSQVTHRQVVVSKSRHAELVTEQVEESSLQPNEVRGRTLATLVSAGTELAVYRRGDFPYHPGYAAVFRVEEVGANASSFAVGDVALTMGPHKSHQQHDVDHVVRVPDTLDSSHATFSRLMAVSMSTLTTSSARPPELVVVTGLGPVGHLAAHMFQSAGYEVIGCDPVKRRRQIALDAGLNRVEASVPLNDPNVVDHVALVAECSGHEQAALDGCNVVQKGGEVVLIGVPWERRTEKMAHELLSAVFHRYVVLRSGWEWELPLLPTEFAHNSIYGNIAGALHWLDTGRASVDGLYDTVSPADAGNVYRRLDEGITDRLAVVFDWTII